MELPKIEKPNFTPTKKGAIALGATIAAIGLGGCGVWDEHPSGITVPQDAKERLDAGDDRAFIMNDTEVNREVFDCGKIIVNQLGDYDVSDPEFIKINQPGKILAVCEEVGSEAPVIRLLAE